jgi:hypothetical protein
MAGTGRTATKGLILYKIILEDEDLPKFTHLTGELPLNQAKQRRMLGGG